MEMKKNMLNHQIPEGVCYISKHNCKKSPPIMKQDVVLCGGQLTSWFLVWEHFKEPYWEAECIWDPLILF